MQERRKRIMISFFISIGCGILVGGMPIVWFFYTWAHEKPGDATGDYIFFVIPIGLLLFFVMALLSFLLLWVFYIRLAKKRH